MATFKSDKVELRYPAEAVFDKLSDLSNIGTLLENAPVDQIPEDKRELLNKITFSRDTISFPAQPVGDVTLQVVRREPFTLIELDGVGTPVDLKMRMEITPKGETCEAMVVVDIAIPAMLKPMVAGPLQKMTDQFSQVLRALKF